MLRGGSSESSSAFCIVLALCGLSVCHTRAVAKVVLWNELCLPSVTLCQTKAPVPHVSGVVG